MSRSKSTGGGNLQDEFEAFLDNAYGEGVEEFANQYPEERYFYVDWTDLDAFDAELARNVVVRPRDLREELEEALRFHSRHDAAYLPDARVFFADGPRRQNVSDLGATNVGNLSRVAGRVVDVGTPRADLETGVFVCRKCGAENLQEQPLDDFFEPVKCIGCDRNQVDYQLDRAQSTFVVRQHGTIEDLPVVSTTSIPKAIDLTLTADAAGDVSAGDWVELTGPVTATLHGEGVRVDLGVEAWSVSQLPREEVVEDRDTSELFSTPDIDLSAEHLSAFATHIEDVLTNRDVIDEMNEEEVKLKVVTPFVELLGWDLYGPEVAMEHENQNGKQLDYALLVGSEPKVCIEAKQPGTLTRVHRDQLRAYMVRGMVEWGLLTDGVTYELFRVDPTAGTFTMLCSCEYQLLSDYFPEFSNLSREVFESDTGHGSS